MRLKVSRSKNAASLYVTKTIYEGKKQRTITVEKLGTEKEGFIDSLKEFTVGNYKPVNKIKSNI